MGLALGGRRGSGQWPVTGCQQQPELSVPRSFLRGSLARICAAEQMEGVRAELSRSRCQRLHLEDFLKDYFQALLQTTCIKFHLELVFPSHFQGDPNAGGRGTGLRWWRDADSAEQGWLLSSLSLLRGEGDWKFPWWQGGELQPSLLTGVLKSNATERHDPL